MPAQLIINADDFGLSSAVNAAVVRARREGVLTSASLMVTGGAASEAVSIARDDPGLAVGLHLTLTCEKPALPREVAPDLVSRDSHMPPNPVLASLNYHFRPELRRQLRSEIEAQFEAFAQLGLPLSHVDGHQHLHAHPAVLPTVIELAAKYGARGIRLPCEPLWPNLRVDRSRPAYKLLVALAQAYLARVCRSALRESALARCDVTIGGLMSGQMTDDYVIETLKSLNCASAEVFFHPSNRADGPREPYGPNTGDLSALLSPKLKRFVSESNWEPTNYAGLKPPDREKTGDRL